MTGRQEPDSASRHRDPASSGSPDLGPSRGVGGGRPLSFIRWALVFGLLGQSEPGILDSALASAFFVVLVVVARRSTTPTLGWALVGLTFFLAVLSTRIGMRSRNLLFVPHVMALASALLGSAVAEATGSWRLRWRP